MKLLIFDFDGPINNLIEAKKKTIFQLANTIGIDFSEQMALELINYIDQIYETQKITDYTKLITFSLEKMTRSRTIQISHGQIVLFSSKFSKELIKNIKLDTKIKEIIKELKQNNRGLKVCIYTSQQYNYVQKLLDTFGFDETVIDKVYGKDSFNEPKPSVVNLKQICQYFRCREDETVIIGDNVTVDLLPGSILGMKTILINQFVDITIKTSDGLKEVLQKVG